VRFLAPAECFIDIARDENKRWHCKTVRAPVANPAAELGADKIIELGVPLGILGVDKADEVRFFVSLSDKAHELERFPASGFVAVAVDPWGLDQQEWMV